MTPSGIWPANLWFVMQCLNQLCHRVPDHWLIRHIYVWQMVAELEELAQKVTFHHWGIICLIASNETVSHVRSTIPLERLGDVQETSRRVPLCSYHCIENNFINCFEGCSFLLVQNDTFSSWRCSMWRKVCWYQGVDHTWDLIMLYKGNFTSLSVLLFQKLPYRPLHHLNSYTAKYSNSTCVSVVCCQRVR
jgi:hypothetical protein